MGNLDSDIKGKLFSRGYWSLDIWELKKAFGKKRAEFVGSLKALALEGRGSEIIQGLMEEEVKRKTVDARKRVIELMTYVINNLDIPKVHGCESDPVEKTVDVTASRGFKKRGMSWYRMNANLLLKLKLRKLSGEWDFY